MFPRPHACSFLAFHNVTLLIFFSVDQGDITVIHFRLLIHQAEYPLDGIMRERAFEYGLTVTRDTIAAVDGDIPVDLDVAHNLRMAQQAPRRDEDLDAALAQPLDRTPRRLGHRMGLETHQRAVYIEKDGLYTISYTLSVCQFFHFHSLLSIRETYSFREISSSAERHISKIRFPTSATLYSRGRNRRHSAHQRPYPPSSGASRRSCSAPYSHPCPDRCCRATRA